MALHFFHLRDFMLYKMIGAHDRAITSIAFSPDDSNLFISCSVACRTSIWNLENEEEKAFAKDTVVPVLVDWGPGDKIALAMENGDVKLWEWKEGDKQSKLFSVGKETAKVVRWHPWPQSRKFLCGAADGSVIFYDLSGNKKSTLVGKSKTTKDAVTDAQWDPLSESFCLIAFKDGSMALYDASSLQELTVFEKQQPQQCIRSIAFAKAQPGNFLTVSEKLGVIKVWNASQKLPQHQIKVGQSGVNCIKAIPNTTNPNQFLLSFKNSSVGVVDIVHRRVSFMSAPGHAETIFDCVFHPDDPDLLATASYDGYVKLWRISTGHHEREFFTEKDQLLYGLSFGPGATHICACSSIGYLFVWKIENGRLEWRTQVHNGQAFRVEWNLRGRHSFGGEIATGGNDGFSCITDAVTGQILKRIQHPDSVVGVSWHFFHDSVLATGCKDGSVRIYNTAPANPELQVQLRGHEARVFNVAFHPICPQLLASGSDDKTIRVWNWSPGLAETNRELRRLVGHTAFVRALLWHSELPGILFSGSWDSTIRVWDVTNQRCLHVCYEHYADVYGLTLHPQRPFFLVSSSRDTTLRFWIFEDVARAVLVSALIRPSRMAELLGNGSEEAMGFLSASPGSVILPPTKLHGQASRSLIHKVQEHLTKQEVVQAYQKIVCFFMYRSGLEDLWGLLSAIRGESTAGASGGRTFFHEQELIACQKSKALELASTRQQIGVAGKQEDRLLKAAQIMLRIGDLRSYCQFTSQAGQWERAICVAPAVSHVFWQEMCANYIDTLSATTDLDEVAPFLVVSGQQARLTDALIERGDLDNAFVVAKADYDNLLPKRETPQPLLPGQGVAENHGDRQRLEEVASKLARRHASMGEPVQAALCYLAVSAGSRAVHALSQAHEVCLAYVVAELLSLPKEPIVLKLLANCAEKDNRLDLAADVWRQHPRGMEVHIPLLAARATDKASASTWAPYTQQQHQEMLDQCQAQGHRVGMVLHEVCTNQRQQAASDGVELLHELFRSPGGWQIAQAREILDCLEALPLQDMQVKDIAGVLSCSAYVGLIEAASLGYHELMFPLAQTLRNIITHQSLQFPASVQEISLIEATTVSHWNTSHAKTVLTSQVGDPNTPAHIRQACEQQLNAIAQRPLGADWLTQDCDSPGLAKIAGGHLPSCYRRHAKMSVLTNQLIRGPTFTLEDNKSHISVTDALAWARVNAFSPLNTGCKINPV